MPKQNRPNGASIPQDKVAIFYIFSAIKANVGITYHDVKNGKVSWKDIFTVLNAEKLFSWIEWENHLIAESEQYKNRRKK